MDLPSIFQEDSSVKTWGCPRHPLLHRQSIRSSLVRLYFNFFTSYVLFLERMCAFTFNLFMFYFLITTCWILALFFGRDTRSVVLLEYSYSSHLLVEYSHLALLSFQLLFSCISCSELLVLLKKVLSCFTYTCLESY